MSRRDFFLLSLNVETRPRLFSSESQCRDETETVSESQYQDETETLKRDLIIEFLCKKFPLTNPFFPLLKMLPYPLGVFCEGRWDY